MAGEFRGGSKGASALLHQRHFSLISTLSHSAGCSATQTFNIAVSFTLGSLGTCIRYGRSAKTDFSKGLECAAIDAISSLE
jgi:hypothetical protein